MKKYLLIGGAVVGAVLLAGVLWSMRPVATKIEVTLGSKVDPKVDPANVVLPSGMQKIEPIPTDVPAKVPKVTIDPKADPMKIVAP